VLQRRGKAHVLHHEQSQRAPLIGNAREELDGRDGAFTVVAVNTPLCGATPAVLSWEKSVVGHAGKRKCTAWLRHSCRYA
jgi:hypothetical protein